MKLTAGSISTCGEFERRGASRTRGPAEQRSALRSLIQEEEKARGRAWGVRRGAAGAP